jgi:L-threonylcarbamoyladenylate synthase
VGEIITVNANNMRAEQIEKATTVLRAGGVIAAPTDTVYGLLCDPHNENAIRRIYEIKGRDWRQPLILLVADIEMVEKLAAQVPEAAREAMARFWPGALTVILPRGAVTPEGILGGGNTVGFRWPHHAVTCALIRAAGGALASTSVNRSGAPAASNRAEIDPVLAKKIDLIVDTESTPKGVESTIVDFSMEPARVIRQGAIVWEQKDV